MEINNINVGNNNKTFESKLSSAYNEKDEKALKQACKDFESIFLQMMYKEMKQTVPTDDFTPKSFGQQTFEDMLDEKVTKNASDGKGIGIADAMYKQMISRIKNDYKIDNNKKE